MPGQLSPCSPGRTPGQIAADIAVDALVPVQLTAAFPPQIVDASNGFVINPPADAGE
ncbi:hypothetical protein SVIO_026760 [Streptomyces violaceusniger]|uniref:Uncharacterized protein n=1 Tax=Streptomyces violaceusniger TaxID=68280 RepID=A0A4D4L231_STRVO|nr:hypothetical protein SVIO_026760 [Streptomyces violaceusniger]